MKKGLDLLSDLKKAYCEGKLSALIGSGFSKNAHPSFPNWYELLKPIVIDFYSEEYERALSRIKSKNSAKSENDYEKEALMDVINNQGSLEIASNYVKRKALGHESIDSHIIQNVPKVEDSVSGLRINKYKLTDDDLSAHKKLLECTLFNNIYTTNYDNLIEKTRDYYKIEEFKKTINSAVSLSGSASERSIIKIHGDLGEDAYEFDGDKNLKFIITKEDYDTYPQKHEAFTNLMKLTMLQGQFCLIGFSGSDPNFKHWLQWMKEVLDRPSKNETSDTKVYLILVKHENIEPERQLFYDNHHIGVINLSNHEIISELLGKQDKTLNYNETIKLSERDNPSPKELILAFFEYLQKAAESYRVDFARPERQTIKAPYNKLWCEVSNAINNNKSELPNLVSKIVEERARLGTPKIIHYQGEIIRSLIGKKDIWTDEEKSYFLLAVKDCGLLPSLFREEDIQRGQPFDGLEVYQQLVERDNTLLPVGKDSSIISTSKDWQYYEKALRYAFSLQFSELKQFLAEWNPNKSWQINKTSLLYLFDKTKAIEILDEIVKNESNEIIQYKAAVISNALDQSFYGKHPLDKFWNHGITGITDIAKFIAEQASPRKKSIELFGQSTKTIYFDKSYVEFKESLRLLQYFINEGFSPTMNITSFLPSQAWYNCFVYIFEYYPWPCLYFSLCIKDEKLSRKIGQEYAYSLELKDDLPKLQNAILKAIGSDDVPRTFIRPLLNISKEIYCALDENIWYSLFEKMIFLPYLDRLTASSETYDDDYQNIISAIENIYLPNNVEKVYSLLIDKVTINPKIVSIIICNHLNVFALGKKVMSLCLEKLYKMPLKDVFSIYYILNHYNLLSDKELKHIEEIATNDGLLFIRDYPTGTIQMSYLLKSQNVISLLKENILASNVWDCGINGNSITSPNIIAMKKLPDSITWTNEEQDILFHNLELNLSLIESLNDSQLDNFFTSDMINVIYSMVFFHSKMTKFTARKDIQVRLRKQLNRLRGNISMLSGLLSDDYKQYENSHIALRDRISLSGIEGNKDGIALELDRALNLKPEVLNYILSSIAFYCENYYQEMNKFFGRRVLLLLEIFMTQDSQQQESGTVYYRNLNLNLPWAYSSLFRIANAFSKDYPDNDGVKYWCNNDKANRFNLVKYWVSKSRAKE